MARSKIKTLHNREFEALEEERESQTSDEIYALIEREKDGFVSFEEYAKRRGIKL